MYWPLWPPAFPLGALLPILAVPCPYAKSRTFSPSLSFALRLMPIGIHIQASLNSLPIGPALTMFGKRLHQSGAMFIVDVGCIAQFSSSTLPVYYSVLWMHLPCSFSNLLPRMICSNACSYRTAQLNQFYRRLPLQREQRRRRQAQQQAS